MTKAESDFLAIKSLIDDAKVDPKNLGWYLASAYWLGRGDSVDDVLRPPPVPNKGLRVMG